MIKALRFPFHGFLLGLAIADAVEISIPERKQTKEKTENKTPDLEGQGREIEGSGLGHG